MIKVLVPVDGSPNALHAVRHVIDEFLRDPAFEVHLLNVQAPFSRHVAQFVSSEGPRRLPREQAEKALAPARAVLEQPAFRTRSTSSRATAPRRSPTRRGACSCDHIVLGTARKNSLTRMLEDSVTNRVLELTRCRSRSSPATRCRAWSATACRPASAALLALLIAAAD